MVKRPFPSLGRAFSRLAEPDGYRGERPCALWLSPVLGVRPKKAKGAAWQRRPCRIGAPKGANFERYASPFPPCHIFNRERTNFFVIGPGLSPRTFPRRRLAVRSVARPWAAAQPKLPPSPAPHFGGIDLGPEACKSWHSTGSEDWVVSSVDLLFNWIDAWPGPYEVVVLAIMVVGLLTWSARTSP